MRFLTRGLLPVLLLAGCGGSGEHPGGGEAGGERTAQVPPTVVAPPATADAVVLDAACTGPEGIRIAHPADWSVNEGTVVPACTRFAPRPFTVQAASDVRAAAVVLSVESVPLADLADSWPGEQDRIRVEVDGRPGLRSEIVTGPGLLPERTVVTRWLLDLEPGGDGPRTLVADTVHPPGTDPAQAAEEVAVLDAMVAALDLDPAAGRLV